MRALEEREKELEGTVATLVIQQEALLQTQKRQEQTGNGWLSELSEEKNQGQRNLPATTFPDAGKDFYLSRKHATIFRRNAVSPSEQPGRIKNSPQRCTEPERIPSFFELHGHAAPSAKPAGRYAGIMDKRYSRRSTF